MNFVAQQRGEILHHSPPRRINFVGNPGLKFAVGKLHDARHADFERSRRVLFQKRRLARREAAFFAQLCADDELEIPFL